MPELIPILLAAQAPPDLVRCLEAGAAVAPLTLAGPRLTTASALLRAAAAEPAAAAVVAATLPGLDGPLVTSLRQLGLGMVVVTWGTATTPDAATLTAAGAVVVAGETLRQTPDGLVAAVRAALATAAEPPAPIGMDAATPGADQTAPPDALAPGEQVARVGETDQDRPPGPAQLPLADTPTPAPVMGAGVTTPLPAGALTGVGPARSWRARRAASLGLTGGDGGPPAPPPDRPVASPQPAPVLAPPPSPVNPLPARSGQPGAAPSRPVAAPTVRPDAGTVNRALDNPAGPVLPIAHLPPATPPGAPNPPPASPPSPALPASDAPRPRQSPAVPDEAPQATIRAAGPAGHVIAVLSGPHGAGGTTVSHGLAGALGPDPVLHLDLDPAGDASGPALDLPATGAGVAGLATAPAARDAAALRTALDGACKPVLPHLRAVLGLARIADGAYLSPAVVADLLAVARTAAAWTVVDLGRWAGPHAPWQATVVAAADLVLLVTRPERPALARLQAWLDEGLLAGRTAGVHLLVNRAPAAGSRAAPPDLAGLSQGLGLPVAAVLLDDPAAAAWLAAHHAPVTLAAGPLALAVRDLALAIRAGAAPPASATTTTPAPARAPGRLSRLRRWLAGLERAWPGRRPLPVPATMTLRKESQA